MLAIELVENAGDATPNAALAGRVNAWCHQNGVVTLTCGTYGNVFRFLPPLIAGPTLLTEGLDVLDEAFAACV